jgi:hypothetical protein
MNAFKDKTSLMDETHKYLERKGLNWDVKIDVMKRVLSLSKGESAVVRIRVEERHRYQPGGWAIGGCHMSGPPPSIFKLNPFENSYAWVRDALDEIFTSEFIEKSEKNYLQSLANRVVNTGQSPKKHHQL